MSNKNTLPNTAFLTTITLNCLLLVGTALLFLFTIQVFSGDRVTYYLGKINYGFILSTILLILSSFPVAATILSMSLFYIANNKIITKTSACLAFLSSILIVLLNSSNYVMLWITEKTIYTGGVIYVYNFLAVLFVSSLIVSTITLIKTLKAYKQPDFDK